MKVWSRWFRYHLHLNRSVHNYPLRILHWFLCWFWFCHCHHYYHYSYRIILDILACLQLLKLVCALVSIIKLSPTLANLEDLSKAYLINGPPQNFFKTCIWHHLLIYMHPLYVSSCMHHTKSPLLPLLFNLIWIMVVIVHIFYIPNKPTMFRK